MSGWAISASEAGYLLRVFQGLYGIYKFNTATEHGIWNGIHEVHHLISFNLNYKTV